MDKENDNNNNDGMTLDKLGQMVAKIVEDMATKDDIKKLDKKIDQTKKELGSQISGVQNRIDILASGKVSYDEFGKLKDRVEKVEEKVH